MLLARQYINVVSSSSKPGNNPVLQRQQQALEGAARFSILTQSLAIYSIPRDQGQRQVVALAALITLAVEVEAEAAAVSEVAQTVVAQLS